MWDAAWELTLYDMRHSLRLLRADRDFYAMRVRRLEEEIAEMENRMDLKLEEESRGL